MPKSNSPERKPNKPDAKWPGNMRMHLTIKDFHYPASASALRSTPLRRMLQERGRCTFAVRAEILHFLRLGVTTTVSVMDKLASFLSRLHLYSLHKTRVSFIAVIC